MSLRYVPDAFYVCHPEAGAHYHDAEGEATYPPPTLTLDEAGVERLAAVLGDLWKQQYAILFGATDTVTLDDEGLARAIVDRLRLVETHG